MDVNSIPLGTGVLTWNPHERRSDRYGAIWLTEDGVTSLTLGPSKCTLNPNALGAAFGMVGRIEAVVLDARESTHIGDLYRGIFPSTPEVGEVIVLGEGRVFLEMDTPGLVEDEGETTVGIRPIDDDRPNDWMDPEKLYRAHEQLVELNFIPKSSEE